MTELQLITFNSWKCDGNYPERLVQAQSLFSKLCADIYLLQEVFTSEQGNYNTLQYLFPQPNKLNCLFQPARYKQRTLKQQSVSGFSGLAVVTPHPVISHGCFSMTQHPQDPHRLCQWCVISVEGILISIFNTHLTHIENQTAIRQKQFNQIYNLAKMHTSSLTVIAGDMNTLPPSLNHPPDFNCCFSGDYPNTMNLGDAACLDHFYIRNTSNIDSIKTSIILDQKHAGDYASDHKGVLLQLTLK